MAETETPLLNRAGAVFDKFVGWAANSIQKIVAFGFFFFAFGAIYGWLITTHAVQNLWLWLAAPFFFGFLAYYSRFFATIAFIALLFVFFI